MSDERLPFPIRGKRRDIDAPQGGDGEAARLLYFTNLLANTAGVPIFAMRKPIDGGEVRASTHGPLAFTEVHAQQPEEVPEEVPERPEAKDARLVWLPEGFVFTPKSNEAPAGYGLPRQSNGELTKGGAIPQVMVNRFAGNLYPEVIKREGGGGTGGRTFAAGLFMMDWEMQAGELGIGVHVENEDGSTDFLPQFRARWIPEYTEPEADQWYCHAPQAADESPLEAIGRSETNLVREQNQVYAQLQAPLRGMAGDLSQDVAYQIRYSGIQDHGSALFREGHQTVDERALLRSGWMYSFGENLSGSYPRELDEFAVYEAVAGWRNSPDHFQNMVFRWESGGQYGSVEHAFTEKGNYGMPGVDGVIGVQIYRSMDKWVGFDSGFGTHGSMPILQSPAHTNAWAGVYGASTNGHYPHLLFKGRGLVVHDTLVAYRNLRAIGGTIYEAEDGTLMARAILLLVQNQAATILIAEGSAHDFVGTRSITAQYGLPENASMISVVAFSESRRRLAISYTAMERIANGYYGNDWTFQSGQNDFFGQTVHHLESIDGGGFSYLGSDQILVVPDIKADRPRHINQTCAGTARFLPIYQGESLRFLTMEYSGEMRQHYDSAFDNEHYQSKRAWLRWPDGSNIQYQNLYSERDENGGRPNHYLKGYVQQIIQVEHAKTASDAAVLRFDLPETDQDYAIAQLIVRGTVIKTASNPLGHPIGRIRLNFNLSFPSYQATFSPYDTVVFSGGSSDEWNITLATNKAPAVPYAAVVIPYGWAVNTTAIPYGASSAASVYTMIGPPMVWQNMFDVTLGRDFVESFAFCEYGGEWLYAGRIQGTLGAQTATEGTWMGEAQYYWRSSLNLAAITGLPDLKNDILPAGVI